MDWGFVHRTISTDWSFIDGCLGNPIPDLVIQINIPGSFAFNASKDRYLLLALENISFEILQIETRRDRS